MSTSTPAPSATEGGDVLTAPRTESAATATPAHTEGTGTEAVLVDDYQTVAGNQLSRSDFFSRLDLAIRAAVDRALAPIGRSSKDCPYLDRYLAYYRAQPIAQIERAVTLYARPSSADPNTWISAIAARAELAATHWRQGQDDPVVAEMSPSGRQDFIASAARAMTPAAVRARLGPGQPLPATIRRRAEAAFGVPLDRVRVHVDEAAQRVAAAQRAAAVTVGQDIAYAAGEYRPGMLRSDAITAHEIAHTVQQRDAQGEASGAAAFDGEAAADKAAMAVLTQEPARPGATSALALQRCGSEPSRDWEHEHTARYDEIVVRVREIYAEQQRIAAKTKLTDDDFFTLDALHKELVGLVAEIQAMGVQLDQSTILGKLVAAQPENLLQLRVTDIEGDENKKVLWGERRKFRAVLQWHPPDVDVRFRWGFTTGDQEGFLHQLGGPEKELDEGFWTDFDMEIAARGAAPKFQILAIPNVGGSELTVARTDWLEVDQEPPATIDIQSARILVVQQAAAAGAGAGASGTPGAPSGTPTVPTVQPAQDEYVLEDTLVVFNLSWVPPTYPEGSPTAGPTYRVRWTITREGATAPLLDSRPHVYGSMAHEFADPGTYEIKATIHKGLPSEPVRGLLGVPGLRIRSDPTAIRTATRTIKVLSQVDLSKKMLEQVARTGEPTSFDQFRSDLSSQVTSAERVAAAGSVLQSTVEDRRDKFREMQRRVDENVFVADAKRVVHTVEISPDGIPVPVTKIETKGVRHDTTLPFPATDGDFRKDSIYVAPMLASFAHPQIGGAQPLTAFVRIHHDGLEWAARIIDASTHDVLHWNGHADQPHAALSEAIDSWASGNDYPNNGRVAYRFKPFPTWTFDDTFSTHDWTKTVMEWFDRLVLVAAVALLLVPEPTGLTKAAGYALLVAGVLRGTYSIYRSLKLGRPLLDTRNILDGIGILTSVIGLSGGALVGRAAAAGTAAARASLSFRVGRGLIVSALAMDVGTFVYCSDEALRQLRQVQADPSIPDSQKQEMLLSTMTQLAAQGLLIFGSNRDLFTMFRPRIGPAPARGFVEAMAEATGSKVTLDPVTRTQLLTDLRRGADPPEVPRDISDLDLIQLHARRLAGTLSAGAYPVQAAPLTGNQFTRARENLAARVFRNAGNRGRLLDRGHGQPGRFDTFKISTTTGTVDVKVEWVKADWSTNPPPGQPPVSHQTGDRGHAAMDVQPPTAADPQWKATIYLDERIDRPDAESNLAHELDELGNIVRRRAADPTADIASLQEAVVFKRGGDPKGELSSHDVAAARELRDLFIRLAGDLVNARQRPREWHTTSARIDAMLETMGFGDTATTPQRITALADALHGKMPRGADPGVPDLIGYISDFAHRRAARQSILAAFPAGVVPDEIRGDLVDHLQRMTNPPWVRTSDVGTPPSAFDPAQIALQGASGGHVEPALATYEQANPGLLFIEVRTHATPVGDMKLHHQFLWAGGGAPPPLGNAARPPRNANPATLGPNWRLVAGAGGAPIPKTTAPNVTALLREAHAAYMNWLGAQGAPPPAGTRIERGAVFGQPTLQGPNAEFGGVIVSEGMVGGQPRYRIEAIWIDEGWL